MMGSRSIDTDDACGCRMVGLAASILSVSIDRCGRCVCARALVWFCSQRATHTSTRRQRAVAVEESARGGDDCMGSGRPAGAPVDRSKQPNPTRSPRALPRGPNAAASHPQLGWKAARAGGIQSCKQEGGTWLGVEAAEEEERWGGAGDAGRQPCGWRDGRVWDGRMGCDGTLIGCTVI